MFRLIKSKMYPFLCQMFLSFVNRYLTTYFTRFVSDVHKQETIFIHSDFYNLGYIRFIIYSWHINKSEVSVRFKLGNLNMHKNILYLKPMLKSDIFSPKNDLCRRHYKGGGGTFGYSRKKECNLQTKFPERK